MVCFVVEKSSLSLVRIAKLLNLHSLHEDRHALSLTLKFIIGRSYHTRVELSSNQSYSLPRLPIRLLLLNRGLESRPTFSTMPVLNVQIMQPMLSQTNRIPRDLLHHHLPPISPWHLSFFITLHTWLLGLCRVIHLLHVSRLRRHSRVDLLSFLPFLYFAFLLHKLAAWTTKRSKAVRAAIALEVEFFPDVTATDHLQDTAAYATSTDKEAAVEPTRAGAEFGAGVGTVL